MGLTFQFHYELCNRIVLIYTRVLLRKRNRSRRRLERIIFFGTENVLEENSQACMMQPLLPAQQRKMEISHQDPDAGGSGPPGQGAGVRSDLATVKRRGQGEGRRPLPACLLSPLSPWMVDAHSATSPCEVGRIKLWSFPSNNLG